MATDLTFANPLSVLPFRASYATLFVELTFWGWWESSKAICADAVVCMANSGVHSERSFAQPLFPIMPASNLHTDEQAPHQSLAAVLVATQPPY